MHKLVYTWGDVMRDMYIKAQSCLEGMVLSEDLCTDTGVCLIPKGTTITEELEKKVRRFRLMPVKVIIYDDALIVEEVNKKDYHNGIDGLSVPVRRTYYEAQDEIKDVFEDLSLGKKVSSQKIEEIVKTIKNNIPDALSVLKCMDIVKTIDDYTYSHCVNVSMLASMLARWLGYSPRQVEEVAKAGLLHDVGKVLVPKEFINKTDKLTEPEYEEVKKHVTYSYRYIESVEGLSADVKMGVLMHHERENGTGYPLGAKSSQIHKYAKIIAIADVYDALTSDRVYKTRIPVFKALKIILNDYENSLDISLANVFAERVLSNYINEYVILNTGEIGQIVHIQKQNLLKPILKIDGVFVDMAKEKDLEIASIFWGL